MVKSRWIKKGFKEWPSFKFCLWLPNKSLIIVPVWRDVVPREQTIWYGIDKSALNLKRGLRRKDKLLVPDVTKVNWVQHGQDCGVDI